MRGISIFILLIIVYAQIIVSERVVPNTRLPILRDVEPWTKSEFEVIAANQPKGRNTRPDVTGKQNFQYSNNQQQRQYQNHHSTATKPNSSRFRALLTEAGAHAITILFACISWRLMGIYDFLVTDQQSLITSISKTATVAYFLINFSALVVQVFKPLVFKNFLKIVIALDIVREFVSIIFNLISTFQVSPVQRELYIGRIIANLFWASAFFSFSRSRWVFQKQAQDKNPNNNANR